MWSPHSHILLQYFVHIAKTSNNTKPQTIFSLSLSSLNKQNKDTHILQFPDMKTEHHHQKKQVTSLKLAKPTAYFIILLLSYALGYLSNTSSSPPLKTTKPTSSYSTYHAPMLHPINSSQTHHFDYFRVTGQCSDPVHHDMIRPTLNNYLFNGTSPFTNFPPKHAMKFLKGKRVKGWGSKGAVFENLIRRVRPKTIIEVGTFLGASAIHMAELTQQLGLNTQILCLDDFRGWTGFRDRFKDIAMINGDVMLYYQFLQNVVSFNLTRFIIPVPFSTGSALMKLCEIGVYGDLVEIDAGHDFYSAWADINRGFRVLRPGGVMFGHDYFTAADNRGVRRAVDLFAALNGKKVYIDGQHWVIESS